MNLPNTSLTLSAPPENEALGSPTRTGAAPDTALVPVAAVGIVLVFVALLIGTYSLVHTAGDHR